MLSSCVRGLVNMVWDVESMIGYDVHDVFTCG